MRKTLRQRSGQALRVFLWMVKGVLLLVALAALVMWPVDCTGPGTRTTDFATGPDWAESRGYYSGFWKGRLLIGRFCWRTSDVSGWSTTRSEPPSWEQWSSWRSWNAKWSSHVGPVRWDSQGIKLLNTPRDTIIDQRFAAPLWVVALAFGVWPAVSLSLLARRCLRRQRAWGRGLCEKCGYDLRATPTPAGEGGAVLAVCPECGEKARE